LTGVVNAKQSQWLDVIRRQQDGAYAASIVSEEQEMLEYSFSELVVHSLTDIRLYVYVCV